MLKLYSSCRICVILIAKRSKRAFLGCKRALVLHRTRGPHHLARQCRARHLPRYAGEEKLRRVVSSPVFTGEVLTPALSRGKRRGALVPYAAGLFTSGARMQFVSIGALGAPRSTLRSRETSL